MSNDFEVEFFNDPHSFTVSNHTNKADMQSAVCEVLDHYKELITDSNATGITFQMLYTTPEGSVALERTVVQPLGNEPDHYSVCADGLVVELTDKTNGVALYSRLAHLSWLAMSDYEDDQPRTQNFWHDPSGETVYLHKENP